jgi:hypothetical protein
MRGPTDDFTPIEESFLRRVRFLRSNHEYWHQWLLFTGRERENFKTRERKRAVREGRQHETIPSASMED